MAQVGGQTINDRILAAKHSLAGQGLAKAVCKATTEEIIGPKKKHLDCKLFETAGLACLFSDTYVKICSTAPTSRMSPYLLWPTC